jgi:quinol monooxygenase YgiN
MTTISRSKDVVTLINLFFVEPRNQQALVDVLIEATESVMKHLPGFISANIHRSLDSTRVVNYAQWRSKEDFEAIFTNPQVLPHFRKALDLCTTQNDGRIYEVVHVDEVNA